MSPTVLFDLNEHEPVTNRSWDPDEARSFVARTIEQIDATFEPARGWVPHPEDDGPNRQPFDGVYNGTAGTMWALTHLARSTGTTLTNDYAAEIARCEQTYRAGKDVV